MPLLGIRTLDDVVVEEKTVLLRVDINCPLDGNGKIADPSRIRAVVPTVSELAERNAKVVVLAHQGRHGKPDCVSLGEHAKMLGELLGQEVHFVPHPNGPEAVDTIKTAGWADVLVLENQRFDPAESAELEPEEHAKDVAVTELAKAADLFVNDAFAAAHRSQRSLVGFCPLLPSAMGRLMEAELGALSKLLSPERPSVFIFGGAKLEGMEDLVGRLLATGRADKVLLAGLTGLAFVAASGHALGPTDEMIHQTATLEEMVEISQLLERYPLKIILPSDYAVDAGGGKRLETGELPSLYPILDIGGGTAAQFSAEISRARTVFISGPPGFFEKDEFSAGTRAVLGAIASRTGEAFTLAGGGHTNAAIEKFGLTGKFSYQSTGGGALETFITGGDMPVLDALKASRK